MKIAVVSDIHGNLAALDAVIADIARHEVDLIVNLGDIVSGPLQPAETLDRLIPLGWPTISGNQEHQLLTLPIAEMGASDAYAVARLSAAQKQWLRELPGTMRIDDILLCHGTPESDLRYFLDHVDEQGARAATADEIEQRAGEEAARLILCGHTHMPRVHRRANGALIVNPGSVGLPAYEDCHPFPHRMENGSPHARYAIAARGHDGAWSAELIAVDYDCESAAVIAAQRHRPDWAIALRTGRMA